jgi:hypothetical protein
MARLLDFISGDNDITAGEKKPFGRREQRKDVQTLEICE